VLAAAIDTAVRPATATEVGNWVASVAAEPLQKRKEQIAEIESKSEVNSGVGSQAKLFLHELASGPSSIRSASTVGMATPSSSSLGSGRTRSKRATLVGLGGFVTGLLVLGLVISASRSGGETASAAPATSTAPSMAPMPQPKVEAIPPVSGESALPSAAVTPPPTGSARPPAKRLTPPVRSTVPAAAAPASKAGKDCDPPYTIDSAGEKHYKRECF
jgi:hypothetical protein